MKTARILVCSTLALLGALVTGACSGATEPDLFGTPPARTNQSSSGSSGASSGSGSSSSGSVDAGPIVDVVDPPRDVNVPQPSVDKGRVFCGKGEKGDDVYCPAGGVCCAERDPGNARFSKYTCQANAAACAGQYLLPIVCDDSQDCPGNQVCCAFRQSPQGSFARYVRTQCVPNGQCAGKSGGEERIRLCDEAASPDECTTSGLKCGPSTALLDFAVCAP